MPVHVANVALSNDLYIITNGLHVSRRSLSSIIVLTIYLLSRSIIGLSDVLDYDLRPAELPQGKANVSKYCREIDLINLKLVITIC